jgi:large subunit ribosomal protein L3
VKVVGTTKGRGFTGVIKRHGFHGGPATHGSKVHRAPQSTGATDPARVFAGTRKPGHMGAARCTVGGLKVVKIDAERNLLLVRGAVPGPNGGLLYVTAA